MTCGHTDTANTAFVTTKYENGASATHNLVNTTFAHTTNAQTPFATNTTIC